MKRKPNLGKLTTAELIEAGHVELANELRRRLNQSRLMQGRSWAPKVPRHRRFVPTPKGTHILDSP